jgi:oxygen-dependent protoporphyrinogen oxidase
MSHHLSQRHVAVIGGGIAGLAAAHALATAADAPQVTLFEADNRVGGKIRTTPFAGHAGIDEGADAFLARVPWATALASHIGLAEQLVSPAAGHAAVWLDGLHPIPAGLLLGMPTEVMALARSSLLTRRGKVRAAVEPLLRRTSLDADSLGGYVRARFGNEVHERLVDPLVGSIYAADTDRFSLAAVPQIAELAGSSRSVLLAARKRPPAPPGPVFFAPQAGMGAFVNAVADAFVAAGGTLRSNSPVAGIQPSGGGWAVHTEATAGHLSMQVDAIVLACPAAAAAQLLANAAPGSDAVAALRAITSADVALVSLAIPSAGWPVKLRGMSGYLVPKPQQNLVTAASFGSQKWAHWAGGDQQVLRISLGRDGLPVLHLDDDTLLTAAIDEVSAHLGLTLVPTHARVTRWPAAFPQYRPHHAQRVATIERDLPAGIAIAGAGYHGIGIPACVRSGQVAAQSALQHVKSLAD